MRYDPDALAALEPGLYAADTRAPLPRRHLGRATRAFLALLRVYVLVAILIVGYAFVHALRATVS